MSFRTLKEIGLVAHKKVKKLKRVAQRKKFFHGSIKTGAQYLHLTINKWKTLLTQLEGRLIQEKSQKNEKNLKIGEKGLLKDSQ